MESSESEDQEIAGDVATEKQEKEEVTGQDLVMKAEGIEVVDGVPSVSGASTYNNWEEYSPRPIPMAPCCRPRL